MNRAPASRRPTRTVPEALVRLTLLAAAALSLPACTTRELYGSAQQWQRNECRKLPAPEQERCLASNAMSFEEYQRQRAAARAP